MIPESGSLNLMRTDEDHTLYRYLIDSLVDCAVFAVSPAGRIMNWNAGAERTFGYAQSEMVGESIALIFTAEDLIGGALQDELAAASTGVPASRDRWYVRKDSSRFLAARSVKPLYDAAGELFGFANLVRAVAPEHDSFRRPSENEHKLHSVLESVHDCAIVSLSVDGKVMSWNAGAKNVFGYTAAEMIGVHFSVLYEGAGDVRAGIPAGKPEPAPGSVPTGSERMLVRKDGTRFLASEAVHELAGRDDGEPRGFVNVLHDISARAAADRDLYHRAHFDELTQLPNRRMFYARLERAVALMKLRSSQPMAVLFVDVDHFKSVNDEFGHIAADRLLAAIARRLERCFRPEDIVARIGGDEFGILIDRLHHTADASEAAERIQVEMRKPIEVDGVDIFLTVSVGIALGSPGYDRPEDILRDADTAMYSAKTAGRARAALFDTLRAHEPPPRADPRISRRISR